MNGKLHFSKFNTYVENSKGEMLIYNSLNGWDGFCKLRAEDTYEFKRALGSGNLDCLPAHMIEPLTKRSMIVDESCDENQTLEYMRMKVITGALDNNVLHLVILPTGKCNFKCEYCYENFENGRMPQEIQDAIIAFVRQKISSYSGVSVSWFGGEPLIELDVIEYISQKLMAICSAMKKTYAAGITTNGYLLTPEVMKKLIKCHVFQYQITLDGARDIHDKYRHLIGGAPTFDRIESNLIGIKNEIKTRVICISIRCNFTKESLARLDDFVQWFESKFGDDKRFSVFVRAVGVYGDGGRDMKDSMLNDGVGPICEKIYDTGSEFSENNRVRISNVKFLCPGGCVCYAGKDNSFVFDSVGKVRKCTVALADDYNVVGEVKDGKVLIDESAFRRWVVPSRMHEECLECSFAGACMDSVCHTNKAMGRRNEHGNCPHEKTAVESLIAIYDRMGRIDYAY